MKAKAFACLVAILPGPLTAEEPLSVIDWMSAIPPQTQVRPAPNVAQKGEALPQEVTVSVLGKTSIDASGLFAPEVTGFPHALWGSARLDQIQPLLADMRLERLPLLQNLLVTLLLAEAEPPLAIPAEGDFLKLRLGKLRQLGALDQAQALIEAAGTTEDPAIFAHRFDIALLLDQADRPCEDLKSRPALMPDLAARIFCQARLGDVALATLTLTTASALGQIGTGEAAELARFLDPELAEAAPVLTPPPATITPLAWRLAEAIGEPIPTAGLPLEFAHAELDEQTAWRARIEAAERLARAGVLTPNKLLGLYTERPPAASGGVWDRVHAFQDFDAALASGDLARIGRTLPIAYARMQEAELEVVFADLYAKPLMPLALEGDAANAAFELILLSPVYDRLTALPSGVNRPDGAFLLALAKGDLAGVTAPSSMARAIAPAFINPKYSTEFQSLADQGRLGEILLLAMSKIMNGGYGDLQEITDGLSALSVAGLEPIARRTALELMILEMRG